MESRMLLCFASFAVEGCFHLLLAFVELRLRIVLYVLFFLKLFPTIESYSLLL